MAANSSWIANVALSNRDSGVCSVASERASSSSRAHSSGSCCCFCAAASAAAVVDRTCASSASCSGLTARATALLQLSTLLPIGFSAIASIFSGDICCAKLALAAAKAGSSGCMLAKTASTLLIYLCTLIASAGFALIAQANWWVACPQSCVDCNSDAMFWTCFEMARPLPSTGVVEPDRVPEFRGRVHADLGWLSCLSGFSNAWRYDFFTPQLRHFFRPLQFPVLRWLQLHSRHSPERQDCHPLSDHAGCRLAMLFQSYLVTRAKRKLSQNDLCRFSS